jgi:hypothetical protein
VLPAGPSDYVAAVAVSPGDATVAVALYSPDAPDGSRVALVDVASGAVSVQAVDTDIGDLLWLDDAELAVAPRAGPIRVYDRALRDVRRLAHGGAQALVLAQGRLYGLYPREGTDESGLTWSGVRDIPLDGGPTALVARVDAPDAWALLVVSEQGAEAEYAEEAPPATTAVTAPASTPVEGGVGSGTYLAAVAGTAALAAVAAVARRRAPLAG